MSKRTERSEHTRLGSFIRGNGELIIGEWLSFAKTRTPASGGMTEDSLRDHIEEILAFVADDLESPQTGFQQMEKSRGEGLKEGGAPRSAAETHAGLRLVDGFDIDQMVSEYRALRASVVKLWRRTRNSDLDRRDLDDLIRFNESIDQATTESIAHYTKTISHSRNLFLGILGHDLRSPIGSATMSATLMLRTGGLTATQSHAVSQIIASTSRAIVIMTDLLDLTRMQVGSEMPITKETMDLAVLGKDLVAEMRLFYPEQVINLEVAGETEGEWDKSRLGQVFSNLIGNAVAHGLRNTPVTVALEGDPDEVTLSVHNQGKPILESEMDQIFESLVQGGGQDAGAEGSHLGLGLYITKKIIDEHRGNISVTSSEQYGTTFTARLPRH